MRNYFGVNSLIVKAILFLIFGLIGFIIFNDIIGIVWGVGAGVILFIIEMILNKMTSRQILSITIGLIFGLIVASLFSYNLSLLINAKNSYLYKFILIIGIAGFVYLGITFGYIRRNSFTFPLTSSETIQICGTPKILDTSVIIDGRIADICETRFLEGTLIIPKFVLEELQHIADSADRLKRNRGRRGLEILKKIQEQKTINVTIDERSYPELKEVDSMLVKMGKELEAKVITNDFNLNKVAELHGVVVLNINDLANALKPVVLPNEEMHIHLMKRGKEYDQGIGYLEDGTMVVVDNARNYIGKSVDVVVTSVIQTAAGRMIFSKLKEDENYNNHWEV